MNTIWILIIILVVVVIATSKRVEYEPFVDPFSIYLQRCAQARMARWNLIHSKQNFQNYYQVPQIYKDS